MESIIQYNESNMFPIGRVGENNYTKIKINVSDLRAELPDASLSLIFQRDGDIAPYPVDAAVDGAYLVWTVSDTDTAVQGRAKAEIIAMEGDVVAKSRIYDVIVGRSLDPSGEVPDPLESWYEDIMRASADVATDVLVVKGFRDEAETFKTDAETAKGETETLKADTQQLKTDTAILKAQTEELKNQAVTAKTAAESAKSAAGTAKASAEASATTATTKASEAEQSANRAKSAADELKSLLASTLYIDHEGYICLKEV